MGIGKTTGSPCGSSCWVPRQILNSTLLWSHEELGQLQASIINDEAREFLDSSILVFRKKVRQKTRENREVSGSRTMNSGYKRLLSALSSWAAIVGA